MILIPLTQSGWKSVEAMEKPTLLWDIAWPGIRYKSYREEKMNKHSSIPHVVSGHLGVKRLATGATEMLEAFR